MNVGKVSSLQQDLNKAIRMLRSLFEWNASSGGRDFLPGLDFKGHKCFYSYNTLKDSNQKTPCDHASKPKQANSHLFREQKVKGGQGHEVVAWKNRPFIMKGPGQCM